MPYTHLIFDFDHMLFDTDQSEALSFQHALRSHGVADPEPLLGHYQRINQGLWREVEKGTISPNEVKSQRFATLAAEADLPYDPEAVAESYTAGLCDHGELYDGAGELVMSLADTFTLAMVTNGLGPVQRGRLDRIGLGGVFEPLVISGEVGVSKPRPEIFQLVFDAFPDTPRSNFLMIGDSLTSDVAGGRNAGIDTCWYDRHGANESPEEPTHRIESISDLCSLLNDDS